MCSIIPLLHHSLAPSFPCSIIPLAPSFPCSIIPLLHHSLAETLWHIFHLCVASLHTCMARLWKF